jgi:hypothetical protein
MPTGKAMRKSAEVLVVWYLFAAGMTPAAADDRRPEQAPERAKSLGGLLRAASDVEKEQKRLCEALLKKASESKLTDEETEDVVATLGRFGYAPAAEFALTRITTVRVSRREDRNISRSPDVTHDLYPAVEALWGIGAPAVGPMVKAYQARVVELEKAGKKKDNDTFLYNIEYALGHKSLCPTAMHYLDKLADSEWTRGVSDSEFKVLQDLRKLLSDDPRNR